MKNDQPLMLLTDYRGAFQSTFASRNNAVTMDVPLILSEFAKHGIEVEVRRFGEIDLGADFRGRRILYTSSEDSGLRYKSFIEDLVLTLDRLGAIVLPRFDLLRAHHNKTMMEGLRYVLFPDEAAVLSTALFGAIEDLGNTWDDGGTYPKVIKAAAGAGSVSVTSASDRNALFPKARHISQSRLSANEVAREHGKRWLRKGWQPRSLHREKFIVQNMVPGLSGDFKVLVYGSRYYVLSRKNRPGDFRASGSGLFSHVIPDGVDLNDLLDFAKSRFERIDSPTLSLDIAFDGSHFWMIEFQALHFGTVTAENSPHYYTKDAGAWTTVPEKCVIEAVFVDAVVAYISGHANEAVG